jgi:limonene-1,2-epoxide hydrolase
MTSRSAKEVVAHFFARWDQGFDEMVAAFYDTMRSDCVWKNSGFPDAIGPEQSSKLLDQMREALAVSRIRIEMINLIAEGPLVVTERRDDLLRADGTLAASMEVLGILEIVDEKIAAWREYADPGAVAEAMKRH